MNRNQKSVYCFIYDDSKRFYRATQVANGSWSVTKSSELYPIKNNPRNLIDCPIEFGTNRSYFSMNRSINYPLEFIHDGAAILNDRYYKGKGVNENLYFAIFEFDPQDGIYKVSYNGRFDFQQKESDDKIGIFKVPVVDDSAWAIISQNDDIEYSIDCSENNPKVIKILIDEFTLKNRFTYQTVQVPITKNGTDNTFLLPFPLVNQDGDSYGLVTKGQTFASTPNQSVFGPLLSNDYVKDSLGHFLYSYYQVNGVNIQGSFQFSWSIQNQASAGLYIFFRTSAGQHKIIFTNQFVAGEFEVGYPYALTPGQIYSVSFDFNINLAPGEKVFFFAQMNSNAANNFTITPIVTNIYVSLLTSLDATIILGLRPLDVLQELVRKCTLDRYTMNSDFFTQFNKTILVPGDSARGYKDAKIYTSFRDFFETFSALFFMALKVVNGSIFMELADEVYKQDSNIIDLGEVIDLKTVPAIEYYCNEIQVGSPKQDYRRASGRLEFNCLYTYSLPFTNIKNKLSFVTKYRTDCFGLIFLILDYKGQSTQDNSGDKSVFVVDITDEQGAALDNIETFENVTVNNAPLSPIIKYPLDGEVINNDKPFLKGVGIPGNNANIYVNDVLDGTAVIDANGNWSYNIQASLPSYDPGVFDGVAVIKATYTDLLGAIDTIQLIIDTTIASAIGITYPKLNDSLYNNLPLVKGVAPAGTNINISLDGVFIAAIVTDNSCRWEYKFTTPIANGNRLLSIGSGQDIPFNVDSFTEFPIITFVHNELDGFPIVNNLPLVKGVGTPGQAVNLWLNYVQYVSLGTAIIDANGNWSIQVVPVSYIDPVTSISTVLAPVRNGLNVFSTLLINNYVQINVTGYKLNRPDYNSITGVTDNTVFNTRFSRHRMMINHKSLLSSIMNKQRNDSINFQTADKNSNLVTILGTEVVTERENIQVSSLGAPLMLLEMVKMKVIAKKTFAQTLYDFNNGGLVKANFRGNDIYCLPIGSMKMKSIVDDVQEWTLIISPKNSYIQLLNLYKSGLTLNLMENALYHSDYNSLHFVEYGKTISDKYNFPTIYDDWFTNRNSSWLFNPQYIQKFQKTEKIRDQIITKGIGSATLRVYDCKDARLITVLNYDPVSPAPIPIPEIVLETEIDFNTLGEGQFFFVLMVGETAVCISERVEVRQKWSKTILIESSNSINKPGVFYSTGFKTIIRVEGLVKKLQPKIDLTTAVQESGDSSIVYSSFSRKRVIRCGTAQGFPDYLAMKVAAGVTNDNCVIEGERYVLQEDESITPSEDIDGVPMYHYDINMLLYENPKGKVFEGEGGGVTGGVTVVVDASAIGLPAHSLIDITEN